MSSALVYWITRLDEIKSLLAIIAIVAASVLGIALIGTGMIAERMAWEWVRVLLPISAFTAILNVFIPTVRTIAAIYLLPKIANNEDVQQIPANTAKLLNEKLQEWIDGLSSDVEKAGE